MSISYRAGTFRYKYCGKYLLKVYSWISRSWASLFIFSLSLFLRCFAKRSHSATMLSKSDSVKVTYCEVTCPKTRIHKRDYKYLVEILKFISVNNLLLIILMKCKVEIRKLFRIPFHEQLVAQLLVNIFWRLRWILSFGLFPPVFRRNSFCKNRNTFVIRYTYLFYKMVSFR